MIFPSIGLPSSFTEWCDNVTARLVQYALGPVEIVGADTIEQFALAVLKTGSPYQVLGSRQTVGRLWTALTQANKGIIVIIDEPRLALENLVVRHNCDFVEATRIVARSCAAVVSTTSVPGGLVLSAAADGANPLGTAETIARHFQLGINEADIANILLGLDQWPWPQKGAVWWNSLTEAERTLASGALDPYVAHFAGGDLAPITWERELFFVKNDEREELGRSASHPADITGRPRYVLLGPYITLAPGSWSATIALGFSQEAAQVSYIVDVHTDTRLAHARIEPGQQRFVEVKLDFSLPEPLNVSIGVYIERAAFDGRVALGHVVLTYAKPRPQTQNYFADALGA
jgi:hypothetical protein